MEGLTETNFEECPRFDHVYKHRMELSSVTQKPKPIPWPTIMGLVSIIILLLGFLWNMADTLATIKAKQVASDQKIDLILGALHLAPSFSSSAPTNASVRRAE